MLQKLKTLFPLFMGIIWIIFGLIVYIFPTDLSKRTGIMLTALGVIYTLFNLVRASKRNQQMNKSNSGEGRRLQEKS
jgi:hypothetical protein